MISFSDVDGDVDATWTGTLQQGHSLYSESEVISLEFQPGGTEPGFQIVYYLSDEGDAVLIDLQHYSLQ